MGTAYLQAQDGGVEGREVSLVWGGCLVEDPPGIHSMLGGSFLALDSDTVRQVK